MSRDSLPSRESTSVGHWTRFPGVYFTDRGIEELEQRRGGEQITLDWLAGRLRAFVDLNPDFEVPVDRLATFLARDDADEES
jgi:hypothetical protein